MTTTEITWGDPIDAANDGKPLPWLKADEQVKCYWGFSGPREGMVTWVHCIHGWKEGFQIKLPADHAYYLATSRGFTYWPGGESAPDDWDGGECLARCGDMIQPVHWCHPWNATDPGAGVSGPVEAYDVIGYRKRAEAEEYNDDYVRVKRMTLAEYQRDDHGSCAWARRVGIIRDETPLEQFEREFGALNHESRHAVKAFIAWQNDHG